MLMLITADAGVFSSFFRRHNDAVVHFLKLSALRCLPRNYQSVRRGGYSYDA